MKNMATIFVSGLVLTLVLIFSINPTQAETISDPGDQLFTDGSLILKQNSSILAIYSTENNGIKAKTWTKEEGWSDSIIIFEKEEAQDVDNPIRGHVELDNGKLVVNVTNLNNSSKLLFFSEDNGLEIVPVDYQVNYIYKAGNKVVLLNIDCKGNCDEYSAASLAKWSPKNGLSELIDIHQDVPIYVIEEEESDYPGLITIANDNATLLIKNSNSKIPFKSYDIKSGFKKTGRLKLPDFISSTNQATFLEPVVFSKGGIAIVGSWHETGNNPDKGVILSGLLKNGKWFEADYIDGESLHDTVFNKNKSHIYAATSLRSDAATVNAYKWNDRTGWKKAWSNSFNKSVSVIKTDNNRKDKPSVVGFWNDADDKISFYNFNNNGNVTPKAETDINSRQSKDIRMFVAREGKMLLAWNGDRGQKMNMMIWRPKIQQWTDKWKSRFRSGRIESIQLTKKRKEFEIFWHRGYWNSSELDHARWASEINWTGQNKIHYSKIFNIQKKKNAIYILVKNKKNINLWKFTKNGQKKFLSSPGRKGLSLIKLGGSIYAAFIDRDYQLQVEKI